MISSKLFVLGLLLSCPFALARVQCNTYVEFNQTEQQKKRTITTEIQLDTHKPFVAYNGDDMRIEATLVSEQDVDATVQYSIYARNAEGTFELITAPELCAVYGKTAQIGMGNTNGDIFTLRLDAQKI